MWKYCVAIYQVWMRKDLNKSWNPGHYKYVEQRYFKTKLEAKKAYASAIRESKKMLNERKDIVGNCHEKVIIRREEFNKDEVFLGIENRFKRGPIEDEIWITMSALEC